MSRASVSRESAGAPPPDHPYYGDPEDKWPLSVVARHRRARALANADRFLELATKAEDDAFTAAAEVHAELAELAIRHLHEINGDATRSPDAATTTYDQAA